MKSLERGHYMQSALKNIIRVAQEMSGDISEMDMLRRENDGILPILPDDFERYDDDDDL